MRARTSAFNTNPDKSIELAVEIAARGGPHDGIRTQPPVSQG